MVCVLARLYDSSTPHVSPLLHGLRKSAGTLIDMQQSNQELATPADSDYHHHPHCHVLHGAGASSNLFTPASSTDSEGRVSLPSSASSVKTFLFSPMELSLSGNISAGSLQLARYSFGSVCNYVYTCWCSVCTCSTVQCVLSSMLCPSLTVHVIPTQFYNPQM